MAANRRGKTSNGFTLIEFIVAMTMLAIILPPLTAAFRAALNAGDRNDQRAESTAEASAILNAISQDVKYSFISSLPIATAAAGNTANSANTTNTANAPDESTNPTGWFIGTNSTNGSFPSDTLDITTLSGTTPMTVLSQLETPDQSGVPMSVYQQVNYSLQPSPQNQGAYQLVRDYAAPPGQDQTDTTDEQILCSHILGLKFEYYDGENWTEDWDSTQIASNNGNACAPTLTTLNSPDTPASANANSANSNNSGTTTSPLLPVQVRITVVLQAYEGPRSFSTTVTLPMFDSLVEPIQPDDTPADPNNGEANANNG